MGQIFNRRRATRGRQAIPYGAVDLGLPSGLLWAQGNIVKDAQGNYSMGNPTDVGCYFSWGNIEGMNPGEESGPSYSETPGKTLTTDIAPNDAQHDAALANLGSPWHLPTAADFQELIDNTDAEYVKIDNSKYMKFMKKTDHSIFILFPYNGYILSGGGRTGTSHGYHSTSTWASSVYCHVFVSDSSEVKITSNSSRSTKRAVRAVCSPNT